MLVTLLNVGCQKEQKVKGLMLWISFSHRQASKWKWLCMWYWQEKEHSHKGITTLTWTHVVGPMGTVNIGYKNCSVECIGLARRYTLCKLSLCVNYHRDCHSVNNDIRLGKDVEWK